MGPSRRIWEGWSLESEALLPEWSTWLLICTCVSTWVGPGASVHGEGESVSCQTLTLPGGSHGGSKPSLFPGLEAGSFTCLNNNVLRINCHWSAPELGQGPSPWLLFTSNHVLGNKHRCVFRASECTVVLPPEEVLVPSDNFTITFHRYVSGKEQVSLVDPQYLPRRHVKLDPPPDLQSNVSSGSCVLTWGVSLALEPLAAILSYELAFKKQEESWEARHKDHIVGVTRLTLEAVELDPGSSYEARLRVQMATLKEEMGQEQHYEGQWSEWSQSVCFPSPQSPAQDSHLFLLRGQLDSSTLVAVPIFLLLTSLTYLVVFKLSPRMKRSFYREVPSPAPFFQALYSVHCGDFQTWIRAHRTGLLPNPDPVGPPQGASESSDQEVIAWLTYDPVDPWQSVVPEDEEEGPGAGLPEAVLRAGHVLQGGQLPAYLPQEDWVPARAPRPAPPQSEGSSGDYCALGCSGGCHPCTFPGSTRSSGPSLVLAHGLSGDQQSLDAWRGSTCVGVSHGERQDPAEWVA